MFEWLRRKGRGNRPTRGLMIGDIVVDRPSDSASPGQWLDWAAVMGAWRLAVESSSTVEWWDHAVAAYNEKWGTDDPEA